MSSNFRIIFASEYDEEGKLLEQTGSQQSAVTYLFAKRPDSKHFRENIHELLKNKYEKCFVLGFGFALGIPLVMFFDYARGFLQIVFSEPISIAFFEYWNWIVYWSLIYSLFLSMCWMIIVTLLALYRLNKEKHKLHITQSIEELRELCGQPIQKLQKNNVELLDISFRRFRAGLAPLSGFLLSSSLKFTALGGAWAIYALANFLLTKNVDLIWYGISIVLWLLGIIFFVSGQFGAWKLWSSAKKDAVELINCICFKKTEAKLNSDLNKRAKNQKKGNEIDADCIQKFSDNMNQLPSVTYTSSSIYRMIAASALTFVPPVIEIIIRFMPS